MHRIKKRAPAASKSPALYNIIEDYSEFDPPGNVWACAMTEAEDIETHARVLSESYAIPVDEMHRLLLQGGIHVYQQEGLSGAIHLVVELHTIVGKGAAGGRVGAVPDRGCLGCLGGLCLSVREARR